MVSLITLVIAGAVVGAKADIWPSEQRRGLQGGRRRESHLTYHPTFAPSYHPIEADDDDDDDDDDAIIDRTEDSETTPCTASFTMMTYDSIVEDIATLIDSVHDDETRSHVVGGIVRLAAHDFMDFDPRSVESMGPDGCFDLDHPNNAGLETVWCEDCDLTLLHARRYAHVSRADFWIASANAVMYRTSLDNALDLRETFRWGRRDRDNCGGSGARLPTPARCSEVEEVFLDRMGLSWRETVALLGAHTLGRGEREFSGHHGTWSSSDKDAQRFNKQYFTELLENNWRMRNLGGPANGRAPQDWTTGGGGDDNGRMMLNTDVCLMFDIDFQINGGRPCCTIPDGGDECPFPRECPMYQRGTSRELAMEAVVEFYESSNAAYYDAFAVAWNKATTAGQRNLLPLMMSCESV